MMQYSKQLNYAVQLFLLGIVAVANGELQFDLRENTVFGEKNSHYVTSKPDPALCTVGYLYGRYSLLPHLDFVFQDNIDLLYSMGKKQTIDALTGATGVSPYSERQYKRSNDFSGGLDLDFLGSWQFDYRNIAYGVVTPFTKSKYLKEYFGYSDSTFPYHFNYTRQYRHTFNAGYSFTNDILTASLSTKLFATQGNIDTLFYDTLEKEIFINSDKDLDQWLRTKASLGVHIPIVDATASINAMYTNHFDRAGDFNMTDYYLLIEGDGNIVDNRFNYRSRTDLYKQPFVTDTVANPYNNGTTGLLQTFYFRDSYTLVSGFFLKGLGIVQLGKKLHKQRYEFALRKVWDNESWIDVGYFNTIGGLFPLFGTYIRSIYHPIEQIGIGLTGKGVWDLPSETTSPFNRIQFLKSTFNGEISWRIVNPIELYVNGDYTYYNWMTTKGEFPNRSTIGLGTRVFIP